MYMRKERGMGTGIQSHVINIGMKERRSTTVNFELVCQLQFIKHSSLRPSRIPLHSLCQYGAVENIAHPCSTITTCHPLYLCIWSDTFHVRLDPRLLSFLCTLKWLGSLGMKIGYTAILRIHAEMSWTTNHPSSLRFLVCKSEVPEKIKKKTTGHRSLEALRKYECTSTEQHQAVSKVMISTKNYDE